MATLNHIETAENRLIPNLIAGGTVGILVALISVSFGAVIFSGELSEALPLGVGLMLFSAIAVCGRYLEFLSGDSGNAPGYNNSSSGTGCQTHC